MIPFTLLLIVEDSWALETLSGKVPFRYGVLSFQVHGMQEAKPTMDWLKKMLEENKSLTKMLDYFRYTPNGPIHFLMDEKAKQSNGAATFFPHNTITLFDYPPTDGGELSSNNQWFQLLVLHELTHIIHIDQVGGIFRWLRTFFGSIIKPGIWTPSWISEGIAVWAESHFGNFGRLRSTLLKRELYRKLRGTFCHDIGCLDSPGKYPFGSYSYWTGGFFMDFLERKNPGAIRCFVQRNSSRLPFFANGAFKACAGEGAQALFGEFRTEFLKEYEKEFFIFRKNPLPHQDQISWFNGTVLQGTVLYYIFWQEQEQFVGSYDRARQKFKSYAVPYPIEHLYLSGQSVWLKTYVGGDERGKRRTYRLEGEQFIAVSDQQAEYEFQTDRDHVFFRYQSFQWVISNGKGKQRKLPLGYGVFQPEMLLGKVFFKLTREWDEKAQIVALDPVTLDMETLEESKSGNIFWAGSCEGKAYLLHGTHGKNKLVQLGGPSVWVSEEVDRMVFTRFSHEAVFVLEKGGPIFESQSCGKYLQALKGEKKGTGYKGRFTGMALTLPKGIKDQRPPRSRSYPHFRHFLPQYWYFSFSSSDSEGQGEIQTELSDPKRNHRLALKADYYSPPQRWGHQVSYTYNPRSFFLGVSYDKTFFKNTNSKAMGKQRESQALVGHHFLGESWSYKPVLSWVNARKTDFLSTRRSHQYAFSQTWILSKKRRHQFLDHLYLKNTLRYVEIKEVLSHEREPLKPYWGWQMAARLGLNLNERWRFRFNFGYSRLFKDGLLGGAIWGGGIDERKEGEFSFHDFHGLEYSDIYGNIITSGGMNIYLRGATPYSQWGFFPLQWQEIGGVGGMDYVRAEALVIDNIIKHKSGAYSVYGGVRAHIKLFYFIQTTADFLYSFVRSEESSQGKVLFSLKGEFF